MIYEKQKKKIPQNKQKNPTEMILIFSSIKCSTCLSTVLKKEKENFQDICILNTQM